MHRIHNTRALLLFTSQLLVSLAMFSIFQGDTFVAKINFSRMSFLFLVKLSEIFVIRTETCLRG